MTNKRANHDLRANWQAQNDAQFANDATLIEIARFLARRAAEKDFQQQMDEREREDTNDS